MMRKVVDISRTLEPTMAVWPGDAPFTLQSNLSLEAGASVNLTTLTLSAHSGSHVDAPYHFRREGSTIEALPLHLFWGPAQVVTVSQPAGALFPAAFAGYDLSRVPRVLVRSAASHLDSHTFPAQFVYPGVELVAFLRRQGIILYGSDAPSMDAADSKTLPGHHALAEHGIAILEGLDLSQAADGLYELVALPLKIAGGEGSPVRAALRSLEA